MPELRQLPSIDRLMREPELARFTEKVRARAARAAVEQMRERFREGKEIEPEQAVLLASEEAARLSQPGMRRVINMSGVVLHTGLGRARLAPEAADAVAEAAHGHVNVEFDLEHGRRGDRHEHVRALLCELTGAEDALVVNNCAGATFLVLAALCGDQEVMLSRGQMVEIGGSFRIPDIVRQSGCRLVEVGCTNKTRLSDFESGRTEGTAAVLRCHTSNYQIVGFEEQPATADLVAWCHRNGLLFLDDLGSGCLVDTTTYGLRKERTLSEAISEGADVVMASGDKMLGGPQAGILVGSSNAIKRVAKHPLARALRPDKLTLAGLEATLRLYREGREREIPTWKALGKSEADIARLAKRLAKSWPGALVCKGQTEVGAGSLPGSTVPTTRVGLPGPGEGEIGAQLRGSDPPIIGRVEDGCVWLDPRTLDAAEVRVVESVLRCLSKRRPGATG